jgi:acetylglutamate kinase
MVLAGKINKEIAALINSHGGCAIGLSGKDGRLIEARKLWVVDEAGGTEKVDTGLVGEVTRINLEILQTLTQSDMIPVIAPIGVGENGETYNINADLVAGAIAGALKAAKLLLMTDVPGVLDAQGNLISSMTVDEAEEAVRDKTLHGGMIPKIQCAMDALEAGAAKVHIIDGRLPHAILLEIFTDAGIGTEILRSGEIAR